MKINRLVIVGFVLGAAAVTGLVLGIGSLPKPEPIAIAIAQDAKANPASWNGDEYQITNGRWSIWVGNDDYGLQVCAGAIENICRGDAKLTVASKVHIWNALRPIVARMRDDDMRALEAATGVPTPQRP